MRLVVAAVGLAAVHFTCTADAAPVTQSLTYDRSGRLACETYSSTGQPANDDAVGFTYDKSDNRLTRTHAVTGSGSGLCNGAASAPPSLVMNASGVLQPGYATASGSVAGWTVTCVLPTGVATCPHASAARIKYQNGASTFDYGWMPGYVATGAGQEVVKQ